MSWNIIVFSKRKSFPVKKEVINSVVAWERLIDQTGDRTSAKHGQLKCRSSFRQGETIFLALIWKLLYILPCFWHCFHDWRVNLWETSFPWTWKLEELNVIDKTLWLYNMLYPCMESFPYFRKSHQPYKGTLQAFWQVIWVFTSQYYETNY